jgi:hypothetical protein
MTPVSTHLHLLRLAVFLGLFATAADVQAQHTRTVRDTMALRLDGEVKVSAAAGSVRVATWDRSAVGMSLRIEGDDATQVQDARVLVEGDSSQVSIRTGNADPDGPGFWDLVGLESTEGPATYYRLHVPATASLRVSTKSASVDVDGLTGDVTVEGTASPIHVRNLTGRVVAGTLSGPLRAENIEGELVFGTLSGNLYLQSTSLPTKSQIGSFSGDAEVVLPADAAFDLKTDITWGGGVTSDFAMPDSTAQGEGPIPIGGGGPMIEFESFSGSLTLQAKQ